ncbi:mucin-7 precursor protein [Colletotrichum tofieldiae]|uniref:Mucin-7 protein n=1 Tax=Colletotrichum tofieldiae TaxID=708197 RepID=A0A161VH14_9PEZI|nr:mucin-7 precursor protein [Colletotrichum tofieldiae]
MSAVKNLRAMFEQKADTSPPDRGRSPGLSSNGTETPPPPARPLSKIRTSFVAIEKDGRMGLRRDPSNESSRSLSQRRLSSHTEGEASVSGLSDKTMATEDTSAGYKTNVVGSPIPESPRRPDTEKPTNGATPLSLGALTDHPSHNPDKHIDVETPTPELLPGDPTQKSPETTTANGTAHAKASNAGAPEDSTKTAKKVPAKLAPPATITRAKTPTRSPITAKTPTMGTAGSKLSAPKPQHDTSKKTPEKTASATPKSGTKPAGANKKPAPVQVSPGGTGFVKPKVKSPTKPVKLPASLMAPTAASVSKVKETPRETLSRASGNQGRPASRASATGAAAPPKTLKRQNSVINRARPSIGPPPKKPLQDHPITKKDKEIDESFLARMMRPTASSSSKLTEKAPVTPPRSRSARPSSGKKSSASRSPKRALSRPAASRTGSPFAKKEAPITQVAPETAKVETAEAAVELAEKAEAPRTPEAKAPVTPEPIVEEAVTESSSTKEAEIEALAEETAAASPELEAVVEERAEEPELDILAQQTVELSLKDEEAEDHELKSPDEFEELLADEKDVAEDKAEAATEVKTETA